MSARNLFHHFHHLLGIFLCLHFLHCVFVGATVENAESNDHQKLVIFTVATEETDGYGRFMNSAKKYGHKVVVLGMGDEWKGGDVRYYAGGGQKVKLLRNGLEKYKKSKDTVVLFSDSYDAVITANANDILQRFQEHFDGAKIVFSAEPYCWPDKSLAVKYPLVKFGKRYLNSGGFMGYAKDVYEMLNENIGIEDDDDDQLYYTRLYLDDTLREKYAMNLDSLSRIFQTLNGVAEDIVLDFTPKSGKDAQIRNIAYGTSATVVHGNGASKVLINWLGNYIGKYWNMEESCAACSEGRLSLAETQEKDLPLITVALFVHKPTYFMDFFFQRLSNLKYPRNKIDLFLHNKEDRHAEDVEKFISANGKEYRSVHVLQSDEVAEERAARDHAIDHCIAKSCRYLFLVDSEAQLTNQRIITELMEVNRPLVAPMLTRPGKLWTNFWGSLSEEGFYARSEDYVELVQYKRKGIWNVPYISTTFLIRRDRLKQLKNAFSYNKRVDADMSFAEYNRDHGFFMMLDNRDNYGHLINTEDYDGSLTHPDLYQIFDNRLDWEQKYIHENYSGVLAEDNVVEQPCPDVYWFPLFSKTFCEQLIDVMEANGKWSDGSNQDTRLAGGYENVPTRDIHMNQVGFERHWLYILDEFVRPVQEKVFIGYFHKPPQAIMNFVVRYRPDEQPSLRPHHDASTYTINLSLNRPHIDYQGGGARFIRYNCSVVETRQGWGLLHPGRLTHYHEGLPTTKGTRYILISFIDP